jgi:hypothetical protein
VSEPGSVEDVKLSPRPEVLIRQATFTKQLRRARGYGVTGS